MFDSFYITRSVGETIKLKKTEEEVPETETST
jgi:hypothetical protein